MTGISGFVDDVNLLSLYYFTLDAVLSLEKYFHAFETQYIE